MNPTIGSREQWRAAREQLLVKEKALNRRRDELAAERRSLPWVLVEKDYAFDTIGGRRLSVTSSPGVRSSWCTTS